MMMMSSFSVFSQRFFFRRHFIIHSPFPFVREKTYRIVNNAAGIFVRQAFCMMMIFCHTRDKNKINHVAVSTLGALLLLQKNTKDIREHDIGQLIITYVCVHINKEGSCSNLLGVFPQSFLSACACTEIQFETRLMMRMKICLFRFFFLSISDHVCLQQGCRSQ